VQINQRTSELSEGSALACNVILITFKFYYGWWCLSLLRGTLGTNLFMMKRLKCSSPTSCAFSWALFKTNSSSACSQRSRLIPGGTERGLAVRCRCLSRWPHVRLPSEQTMDARTALVAWLLAHIASSLCIQGLTPLCRYLVVCFPLGK